MLLEANDVSTRISAARRQLFAERTFARSSSVLNPQLWAAVGRELPVDAAVVRNLIDNWLGAIGERPLAGQDRHGRDRDRACAGRGSAWLDRSPVCLSGSGRDDAEPIAPRARRRLDIRDLRRAADRRSGRAGRRARLLRSLRSEHARGHRRRARGGARADRHQCAWPRHARAWAPGLEARSGQRSVGGNPLSPRDDVCGDLGCRAAGRACGRRRGLAQYRGRHTGRRRGRRRDRDRLCDAPARGAADGRARVAAKRGLGPLENARLCGRVGHFPRRRDRLRRLRHFPHQSGDLPQRRRRRPHHRRYHRPGRNRSRLQARWADRIAAHGDGWTATQCARADLRHPARRRPPRGGGARLRGGAEAMGRAVAGHVRHAALGLFRLLVRRRHPVLVVVDRRGDRFCRRRVLHPAYPELAWLPALAADAPRLWRAQFGSDDLWLYRRHRRRAAWPARRSASMFRNSR